MEWENIFSLKGKVAVVSGGDGLLGGKIAFALGKAGAKLYIASNNQKALSETAQSISSKGIDVTALPLDLGNEQSVLDLRDEIFRRERNVDILVNNANVKMMNDWKEDAALLSESLRINAGGLFVITRAFGDRMALAGKGSIINIGSINGMRAANPKLYEGTGVPAFLPDYYYHKAGVINFSRITASYYGRSGVRCNCISPSGIKSVTTPAVFEQYYSDRSLLGRMAVPEDILGAVVFLASDASQYITGINLPIDGGCMSC